MTRGDGMVIEGGGCHEMFLYSFLRGPCRLPCVLLITLQRIALIPVYYFTFLCDIIPVLWGQYEASESITILKIDLDAYLTNVLETFARSLM